MIYPLPELLAPVGDEERLRSAIEYGADAVYLGADKFGMRTAAASFGMLFCFFMIIPPV